MTICHKIGFLYSEQVNQKEILRNKKKTYL